MSVGPIELVLFVAVLILALVAHVIIIILGRKKEYGGSYRGFLVYGVSLCFAAAAILTPPDLLSMLVVAVPSSLVYGIVTVMSIRRRTRASLS
ncbi:MAG: hypothetical protein ACYS32_16280 [Planctomycetota bacterium]|jgi:hypothetical protein